MDVSTEGEERAILLRTSLIRSPGDELEAVDGGLDGGLDAG